jgi:ABC-type multidrug transport system fused ATPase/permease subunit
MVTQLLTSTSLSTVVGVSVPHGGEGKSFVSERIDCVSTILGYETALGSNDGTNNALAALAGPDRVATFKWDADAERARTIITRQRDNHIVCFDVGANSDAEDTRFLNFAHGAREAATKLGARFIMLVPTATNKGGGLNTAVNAAKVYRSEGFETVLLLNDRDGSANFGDLDIIPKDLEVGRIAHLAPGFQAYRKSREGDPLYSVITQPTPGYSQASAIIRNQVLQDARSNWMAKVFWWDGALDNLPEPTVQPKLMKHVSTMALASDQTVINLLASWLRSLILVTLSNSLAYQVIVNLFRHLMRLPLDYFEKRHVGDTISRFGSTQPISQLISQGMIAAFIDGLMAVLTLALMFVYSALLGGLACAALGLYVALRLAFLQAIKFRNLDVITTMAKENSTFIESVRGIAAIKAFGQEGNRQRLWQKSKADAVNAQVKLGRLTAAFDALGQFVIGAERVVFVYIAITLAFDSVLTVGMIFAFQAYKQQFLDAGMRLTEQAINYQIVKVHLTRIADIALSPTEEGETEKNNEEPDFTRPLTLDRVFYRYGSNEPMVLQGVSLKIEPGEFIAITGPSGGGKTTLMKILMGLFEPSSGGIHLGERPISSYRKGKYRRCIGSVAQGDMLYAGSLAENIAFFDPNIDMERVRTVAEIAHIHTEIAAMPMGYQTLVGDMGSVLSGGQLQRIFLARALYPNPKILMLDESTANLDAENEDKILETMRELSITRIAIAHRPKTAMLADRIFLVKDGSIQEVKAKIG